MSKTKSLFNQNLEKTKQLKIEQLALIIHFIRGEKVLLDSDLAKLYDVPVKRLNEQVKRNLKRFPPDFMFQLTNIEYDSLRSQKATLKKEAIHTTNQKSQKGSHRKYLPYVFTEQGVAMLSSVLNSNRAIEVNIEIMRAFVRMRRILSTHEDLAKKIEALEKEFKEDRKSNAENFNSIFEVIRQLILEPEPKKNPMGFRL